MNVIATNCAGSYVMTHKNSPLGNPFVWSFISYNSIRELLSRFDCINFDNVKLVPSVRWKGTYTLCIDDCVEIHYIHYHYNPSVKGLKVHNNDVASSNITQFIMAKYKARLQRMRDLNEDPCFLILQNNSAGTTEDFLDLYNNTPLTKYKICWGVFTGLKVEPRPNMFRIGPSEMPAAVVKRCYSFIYKSLYA